VALAGPATPLRYFTDGPVSRVRFDGRPLAAAWRSYSRHASLVDRALRRSAGRGDADRQPRRHVTAVAEFSDAEAEELGPLLRRTSSVVSQLVEAEQVYNCLWSHAGGVRGHLHYVVQPVTKQQMSAFDAYGPGLTLAMSRSGQMPDVDDVERVAERARRLFAINSAGWTLGGGEGDAHGLLAALWLASNVLRARL
jgi:diadenosine tetraphosphate (Ap4A) HIT family hydrolase